LTSLPNPASGVIYKELAEGAVLFSSTDEVYFGLNEVGARIWQLLPPATSSLDELVERLAGEYADVPADTIRADTTELLAELGSHGLVVAAE
jgi:hypothetical protein